MAELKLDSSPVAYNALTEKSLPLQEKKDKVIDTVQQVKQEGRIKTNVSKSDEQSVADVVEEMNQSDAIRNTSLQFVVEERGDPPVVKVMDRDSGEMIRQIPSELVVKLSKALDEMADNKGNTSGFLFDKQV
ncbi:flagellar protein FlaG [uncultured Idiomarina sp.]|uniref:flagellar protein FlaG n=1 Tax=uncultured Idiomarina sp. TaxID=352961 RepID=UPI002593694F|nr:flagellar protein FlaG [uncultured Idiomarina sp.]